MNDIIHSADCAIAMNGRHACSCGAVEIADDLIVCRAKLVAAEAENKELARVAVTLRGERDKAEDALTKANAEVNLQRLTLSAMEQRRQLLIEEIDKLRESERTLKEFVRRVTVSAVPRWVIASEAAQLVKQWDEEGGAK